MNYFAYGSNMSIGRLKNRITDVVVVGTYVLYRHDLRFHKISDTDGSAKCDTYYTGRETDSVYGVLYRINEEAKQILDKIEGLGAGYEEKRVQLISVDDYTEKEAFTYCATDIDPSLRPYEWYVRHVLKGAIESGFPKGYLNKLESVKTVKDSDRKRKEKELSIYEHVPD